MHYGFTLVELAIVLFVITLLLGGMLTPLTQQIAERQAGETRRTLENARIALVGYALSHRDTAGHPYLPCPGGDDGVENRQADGHCAAPVGLLPWHTLGTAETDAWGNRLGYAVAPDFAAAGQGITTAAGQGITTASVGNIELCQGKTCPQPLAAAAVLLSHGRNGLGAHNSMGKTNLAPRSGDERENADTTPRFIMRPPSDADRPDGEFDDQITWLSPAWLLGRLCDPAASCTGGVTVGATTLPTAPPPPGPASR